MNREDRLDEIVLWPSYLSASVGWLATILRSPGRSEESPATSFRAATTKIAKFKLSFPILAYTYQDISGFHV